MTPDRLFLYNRQRPRGGESKEVFMATAFCVRCGSPGEGAFCAECGQARDVALRPAEHASRAAVEIAKQAS